MALICSLDSVKSRHDYFRTVHESEGILNPEMPAPPAIVARAFP